MANMDVGDPNFETILNYVSNNSGYAETHARGASIPRTTSVHHCNQL